jgi:FxLD family lantipeptide
MAEPEHLLKRSANWKEFSMSPSTKLKPQSAVDTEAEFFDLDISVLESSGEAAALINLTDDGCGSTCSSPCATNMA